MNTGLSSLQALELRFREALPASPKVWLTHCLGQRVLFYLSMAQVRPSWWDFAPVISVLSFKKHYSYL